MKCKHTEEYTRIHAEVEAWPQWKIDAYNNCIATSAHAKKITPKKPRTNADRIRGMTDDELHKFLLDFEAGDIDYAKTFCDLCCQDAALEQRSTDCDGCLLWWLKNDATLPQGIDWLQQPAETEGKK